MRSGWLGTAGWQPRGSGGAGETDGDLEEAILGASDGDLDEWGGAGRGHPAGRLGLGVAPAGEEDEADAILADSDEEAYDGAPMPNLATLGLDGSDAAPGEEEEADAILADSEDDATDVEAPPPAPLGVFEFDATDVEAPPPAMAAITARRQQRQQQQRQLHAQQLRRQAKVEPSRNSKTTSPHATLSPHHRLTTPTLSPHHPLTTSPSPHAALSPRHLSPRHRLPTPPSHHAALSSLHVAPIYVPCPCPCPCP